MRLNRLLTVKTNEFDRIGGVTNGNIIAYVVLSASRITRQMLSDLTSVEITEPVAGSTCTDLNCYDLEFVLMFYPCSTESERMPQ